MRQAKTLLILLFAFQFLHAQPVRPNLDQSQWVLSGGIGKLEKDPISGERCLTISGSGEENDSNFWRLDYPFEPNGVYKVSCLVRVSPGTKGDNILIGTNFSNRDVRATGDWAEREIIFKTPSHLASSFLRLGQWRVDGKVWFRDIKVLRLSAIFRQHNALELGNGESIKDELYRAAFGFRDKNGNFSRCLFDYNAYFNSYRWDMKSGQFVIYRHEISSPKQAQLSASMSVNIGYHTGGSLIIEASRNGKKWQKVGSVKGKKRVAFSLPQQLFPTSSIYVRLRANGLLARLQIYEYEYQARLSFSEDEFVGKTDYAVVLDQSRELDVRIHSMTKSGLRRGASTVLSLRNNTGRKQKYHIIYEIDGKSKKKKITLSPFSTAQVELPIAKNRTINAPVKVEVKPGGKKKSVFRSQVTIDTPYLQRVDYGYLINRANHITFWWTDAMRKVSRDRLPPDGPKKKTIEYYCAKNEYEPMQLILSPDRDVKDLRVDILTPRHKKTGKSLPQHAIQVNLVDYVFVQHPTDAFGVTGFWPDPLPPIKKSFSLKKNENQPLWITVHVPENAEAGDYWGQVRIRGENWAYSVPIKIHVWNFVLPKETHLQSAFGFSPSLVKEYHHFSDRDNLTRILDKYFRNFAEHRIAPYDPFVLAPFKTSINVKDKTVQIDFSQFDAAGHKYLDEYGFTSFRLNLEGLGSGTFHSRRYGQFANFKQGSQEYNRLMRSYLRQIQDHLRKKGWLDRAYIYWFDEPDKKDYEFVKETMGFIHGAAPELTRMLTEEPEPELFGYVDLWCPLTANYDHSIAEQRRKKGERFWWYICTSPKEPYCTLFIDHNAVELRTWIWQSWKYGLDGILIWQTNYWTSPAAYPPPQQQNPYKDPMSYRSGYGSRPGDIAYWGNGDGRFIYPPKSVFESKQKCYDGPVNSIRWELLREGLEDYEYFWLLRKLIKQASSRADLQSLIQSAQLLLKVPDEVTKSLTEFSQAPEPIYNHRAKLAVMIEELIKVLE